MPDLKSVSEKGRQMLASNPQMGICFSVSADYGTPIMDNKAALGDIFLKDMGMEGLTASDKILAFRSLTEEAQSVGFDVAKKNLGPSGMNVIIITPRDGEMTRYAPEKHEFA